MHMECTSLPTRDDLHDILEDVRRETSVPGIGAASSIAGTRLDAAVGSAVLSRGHALNERSRFALSRLMKLVTSLLALELAARGQFDLDAPMCDVWAELKVQGRKSASVPGTC